MTLGLLKKDTLTSSNLPLCIFMAYALPGVGSVPGVTTNGHTVESMTFNAAGLANYSLAATAITRSLFRYLPRTADTLQTCDSGFLVQYMIAFSKWSIHK